ncbi:MAG: M13 family metallopeptidase [Pseudomonadota bacterium]
MMLRLTGVLFYLVIAVSAAWCDQGDDTAGFEVSGTLLTPPDPFRGLDRPGMDRSIDPGSDFYRFANGSWFDQAVIEPGNWQVGTLQTVRDRTDLQAEMMVREIRGNRWSAETDEAKFLTIYRNYVDRNARRSAGLRPIQPFLRLIDGAETHEDIATLVGSYHLDVGGLFQISLRVDPIQGKGYVASIEPAELLLETKSLYIRPDALASQQKEDAKKILTRLLRRTEIKLGMSDRIEAVLALEHQLASIYPNPVSERQPIALRHVFTSDQLEEAHPEFAWNRFLAARGIGEGVVIQVRLLDQLDDVLSVFNATPVDVWKDYLTLRLMLNYGGYLDEATALLVRQFDAARLGVEYAHAKRRDRAWKVALNLLPDAVGRAYIDQYLSDAVVDDVTDMTDWMLAAYREHIQNASWLTEGTREQAIAKLDAIRIVVGRPPGWNNFDGFRPIKGNLFANAYSRQQLRHRSALSRLRPPAADAADESQDTERLLQDIFFSPLGVGAFYLPSLNTIVIPAAYLQAPYFDRGASLAVNFGALGTTLGHEIGHAFDDQGALRGPNGQLENWWKQEDFDRFNSLGDALSKHLASYEAAPGIPLNTKLTLGENLSDLAGVEIAWQAFKMARKAQTGAPPSKDEAQAFFLSYAQKRRSKRLPTVSINFAYGDVHSPPAVRVNGILPHVDSWYTAFDVTEAHPMWLAPEDRIQLW